MKDRGINITLGTAGHIDHGKTMLIKCLTGCDTDRLKMEKQRGMSIDLGFAPCTLGEGQVGIVDVPGHEKFIKTMVAGVTGIDGIIMVIAADDGVMPQTREHLDILSLLGIDKGIVVLTKVDCVGPQRVNAVEDQIRRFCDGTFLQNSPVIPFSSVTGYNASQLLAELNSLVDSIVPRETMGVFRMPIERTFSLKGYGSVVTGIAVSGQVGVGQEVTVLPQGFKSRVRAIQVYKHDSDKALCGQCAAINVPQCDYRRISRGDVLTVEGLFEPGNWFFCRLRTLSGNSGPVKFAHRIKFHSGTCESAGTIFLLEGDRIGPGSEQLVQIRTNKDIVLGPGDKFIVRDLSPVRTIGGGVVIEPMQGKLRRRREKIDDLRSWSKCIDSAEDFALHAVESAEHMTADARAVAKRCKLKQETAEALLDKLAKQGKTLSCDGRHYISRHNYEKIKARIIRSVRQYHQAEPASPGLEPQELVGRMDTHRTAFEAVLKMSLADGELKMNKGRVGLSDHKEQFADGRQKLAQEVEAAFYDQLFKPPSYEQIERLTGTEQREIARIVGLLIQQKSLVRTQDNMIFHSLAVEKASEIAVEYIRENGQLESVKFKYLLDTTRKFALPMLDYLDQIGITRRVGNTRYLARQG